MSNSIETRTSGVKILLFDPQKQLTELEQPIANCVITITFYYLVITWRISITLNKLI